MNERYFRAYILPKDDDIVYVGLNRWLEHDGNETPMLGTYLCDAEEVHARFDLLEVDLKKCRAEAIAALGKLNIRRLKN